MLTLTLLSLTYILSNNAPLSHPEPRALSAIVRSSVQLAAAPATSRYEKLKAEGEAVIKERTGRLTLMGSPQV